MNAFPVSSASEIALSIVIPFYNEGESLGPLLAELRATVEKLGVAAETIAVDDGSTDHTARQLAAIAAAWPALRVITLPRNAGQAAALWEGFRHCRGDWIAMLDGDGQNPPAELPRLWEVRETADMIAGIRLERRDSPLRKTMSRLANSVRRALLRDGVTDTGCSLKLFRRKVVASFIPIRTMYSFLPAFAAAAGWRVREIGVAHRPRRAGVSKYGLRAMAILPLLDLLALCWLLRRIAPQRAADFRKRR